MRNVYAINWMMKTFLFDELAEPYRDRLIIAMADSKKVREYSYTKNGQPIIKLKDIKKIAN